MLPKQATPMRRLSSPLTVAFKRLVPLAGLAAGALLSGWWLQSPAPAHDARLGLVLAAVAVAFSLGVIGLRARNVADEVWLEGDMLIASKGTLQARIPLVSIEQVSVVHGRQARIRLDVRHDTALGRRIEFLPAIPAGLFGAWKPHPIMQELRDRVAAASSAGA